jgi:hypothetical protein
MVPEQSETVGAEIEEQPRRRPVAGWLALAGAAAVAVGSFGPWVVWTAPFKPLIPWTNQSGTSGDGVVTAPLAILAAVLLVFCLAGRLGRKSAWLAFVVLLAAAALGGFDWVDERTTLEGNSLYGIGWGLHAVATGAVVAAMLAPISSFPPTVDHRRACR